MKASDLIDINQAADLLGMSKHNVKYYQTHKKSPIPHYKRRGSKVSIDGKPYTLPSTFTARIVFVKSEILNWVNNL